VGVTLPNQEARARLEGELAEALRREGAAAAELAAIRMQAEAAAAQAAAAAQRLQEQARRHIAQPFPLPRWTACCACW
jgi:hypothetical protein